MKNFYYFMKKKLLDNEKSHYNCEDKVQIDSCRNLFEGIPANLQVKKLRTFSQKEKSKIQNIKKYEVHYYNYNIYIINIIINIIKK